MFDVVGGVVIAEYDGQNWTPVIQQAEVLRDGRTLRISSRIFDVNTRGDIVFAATSPSNTIFVRTVEGNYRTVYRTPSVTPDGDLLLNFLDVELRDDGRVHLVAIDASDRNTLYAAQPLF
jgi:hypothetical protein